MQVRLLVVAALCAGCSFPDVTFGGGPATGGGGNGDGAAAPTGGNGGGNGGSPPIGGAPACDLDLDGVLAEKAGCCAKPDDCDCDDDDDLVFSGQELYFAEKRKNIASASSPVAFDYDCSGENDEEFAQGTCDTLSQCLPPTTAQVFQPNDQYACGAVGNRRYCTTTCQQEAMTLRCR